ncbi:MAG: hypothetical protein JO303_13240 [Caulobacteraceae bacterium]|nr:hypothetical protein [Caulobacteraceae bacterium]
MTLEPRQHEPKGAALPPAADPRCSIPRPQRAGAQTQPSQSEAPKTQGAEDKVQSLAPETLPEPERIDRENDLA